MPREILSSTCFLCSSAADYFEFDHHKRRHYRCTAEHCGEYVITDTVRRRLNVPHAVSWKRQASALAKRLSNQRQILEIWVNPEMHVLETHLVKRSPTERKQVTA